MKRILVFIFLSYCVIANSQSWSYSRLDPNYSDVNEISVACLDKNNNQYLAGNFEECYHCGGPSGFFVCKINSSGNIVWMDSIYTGPHYAKLVFNGLYINDAGKVCATGLVFDSINFFGFPLAPAKWYSKGFYSEFDTLGNCLLAKNLKFRPYKVIQENGNDLAVIGECDTAFSNLNFTPSSN